MIRKNGPDPSRGPHGLALVRGRVEGSRFVFLECGSAVALTYNYLQTTLAFSVLNH